MNMKNTFLTIALCAASIFASVSTSSAQNLKFGHINSAELIAMMPEIKSADASLQDFGAQLESQLKTMSTEYQGKLQEYQSKQAMMAEAIKKTKEKEIMDLQTRIQEFQQTAQESIEQKKEELYAPILKKAEDAILGIAKENGYAYIFDTSTGSVIYGQDSDNIMPLAKKKLGIVDAPSPTTPTKK
jgi:outer membrane protein